MAAGDVIVSICEQAGSDGSADAVGFWSSRNRPMETNTVEVGIEFFLPTDARHWIPNGFANVKVQVDAEVAADGSDADWHDAIEAAAEAWCEQTHGKGSFSQVIMEP